METLSRDAFRPGWETQMKELYLRLDDVAAHVVQQFATGEPVTLSVLLADTELVARMTDWLDQLGFRRFRFITVDAVSGVLLDTVNQQKLRISPAGNSATKRLDAPWRTIAGENFAGKEGTLRAEICVPASSKQETVTGIVPRAVLEAMKKQLAEAGGDPKRLPHNNAFQHYPEAKTYEDLFLLAVEERGLYPQQFAEEMESSQLPPLSAVPFYAHEGATLSDEAEKASA